MSRNVLLGVAGVFLAGFLVISALGQQSGEPLHKVDLGSFAKEIMVLKLNDDCTELAMWLPHEFFVHANVNSGSTIKQAEKDLKSLKPYHFVAVQYEQNREDGTSEYASLEQIKSRARLQFDDGSCVTPLDQVPPQLSAFVEAFKAGLADQCGPNSDDMHVIVFPATPPSVIAPIDTAKKHKLTLILEADAQSDRSTFVWRTPFDAVNVAPPCGKCKEPMSVKWTYCPWCGAAAG